MKHEPALDGPPRFTWLLFSCLLGWVCCSSSLTAAFHVPYQNFRASFDCPTDLARNRYFRPEYVELVQRLDSETIQWMARTYPILGWREMDSRVYTPRDVPGADQDHGFVYDPVRRHLQLEALFHFGPVPGNGTLISELIELDENRMLTVNEASRNLSVVTLDQPDIAAVIPAPAGLAALEINLPASELYLVERRAAGILLFSLDDYSILDTLMLDFHPGALLLSQDTRYLYITDEARESVFRWDLSEEKEPLRVRTLLKPPYLLALDQRTGSLLVIGTGEGKARLFSAPDLMPFGGELSLGGGLMALCAPGQSDWIFLAAGGCEGSAVFRLSVDQEREMPRFEYLAGLNGPVGCLAADPEGNFVYAVSGTSIYCIDTQKKGRVSGMDFNTPLQRVLPWEDKVFVTGGIKDLFVVNSNLSEKIKRLALEMGPGPMIARKNRLYVANGLSSSITILDTDKLREEISVLVGVLLGQMVYLDGRIVVNNCFRENIMVLDPFHYRIEEIIPVGGSMAYSPYTGKFVLFGDSLAVSLDSPPTAVSVHEMLDLPGGVKMFAPVADQDIYLVLDTDRYLNRVDLGRMFNSGRLPVGSDCTGLVVQEKRALLFLPGELFLFSTENDGLSFGRTYPARPFKALGSYLATDGFARISGSILQRLAGNRLVDMLSTSRPVSVLRQDPDTTYLYVGTQDKAFIFDRDSDSPRAMVPVADGINDIYLPKDGLNGYISGGARITVVDRQNLFRKDEIDAAGDFVYVSGDDLFLKDYHDRRQLTVCDGLRGSVYQSLGLPVAPTDVAADRDRLYLLGGAQGALAVYVNLVDTARLPRSPDRSAWDTDADRRTGTHR